jgi:hypothetical protein
MIQKTTESPIEEIHRTRREISDRFDGDVFAIAEDAARRQAASKRPIWKPEYNEPSDTRESADGRELQSTSRSPTA